MICSVGKTVETGVIKMKQSTKKYLQDLFDGKYKDEPTLNSKESAILTWKIHS